jgi:hypothetical protein
MPHVRGLTAAALGIRPMCFTVRFTLLGIAVAIIKPQP